MPYSVGGVLQPLKPNPERRLGHEDEYVRHGKMLVTRGRLEEMDRRAHASRSKSPDLRTPGMKPPRGWFGGD